ncbi:hypothetical protein BHM03_00020134 [Ensete ventricosum]|nr:hypothetical protein BHM03_00020134 [Ensete ventricosum]
MRSRVIRGLLIYHVSGRYVRVSVSIRANRSRQFPGAARTSGVGVTFMRVLVFDDGLWISLTMLSNFAT